MGVYIKDMKMPTSCLDCPCVNGENGYCQLRKECVYDDVPRSCPLLPVPPHGRLFDADVLMREMHNVILEDGEDRRIFYSVIERQPTVIPAEEGE